MNRNTINTLCSAVFHYSSFVYVSVCRYIMRNYWEVIRLLVEYGVWLGDKDKTFSPLSLAVEDSEDCKIGSDCYNLFKLLFKKSSPENTVRIGGLTSHTSYVYINECSARPYSPVT